jgi:sugar/nucleoside kinase (ribokinase family)
VRTSSSATTTSWRCINEKTGLGEGDILERAGTLVVTRGENGSTVLARDVASTVPAVTPHRIADPTGVGDAYRGGFMKGIAHGADLRSAPASAASPRPTRSSISAA